MVPTENLPMSKFTLRITSLFTFLLSLSWYIIFALSGSIASINSFLLFTFEQIYHTKYFEDLPVDKINGHIAAFRGFIQSEHPISWTLAFSDWRVFPFLFATTLLVLSGILLLFSFRKKSSK